jgi:hypothetical protein
MDSASIHQILTNEKYIGNNIFNRVSYKLKQRRVVNQRDTWVRADGAFTAVSSGRELRCSAYPREFSRQLRGSVPVWRFDLPAAGFRSVEADRSEPVTGATASAAAPLAAGSRARQRNRAASNRLKRLATWRWRRPSLRRALHHRSPQWRCRVSKVRHNEFRLVVSRLMDDKTGRPRWTSGFSAKSCFTWNGPLRM